MMLFHHFPNVLLQNWEKKCNLAIENIVFTRINSVKWRFLIENHTRTNLFRVKLTGIFDFLLDDHGLEMG